MRRHTIGLIPVSQTLICRIDAASATRFSSGMGGFGRRFIPPSLSVAGHPRDPDALAWIPYVQTKCLQWLLFQPLQYRRKQMSRFRGCRRFGKTHRVCTVKRFHLVGRTRGALHVDFHQIQTVLLRTPAHDSHASTSATSERQDTCRLRSCMPTVRAGNCRSVAVRVRTDTYAGTVASRRGREP
jgi:hypothetical protein